MAGVSRLLKPRQGVLKTPSILKYCLSSGTKTIQDCQSQQLQQALEIIRRTSFNETWKRVTFASDCEIKATFWISCLHKSLEEKKKKKRFVHLCFDSTLGRIGLYQWNPASAGAATNNHSLSTAQTEIHFAVPVWAGKRGIHSFPPLSRWNVVSLSCQSHQLPNGAGKIKQTKVMLHQISPSQPRQVPRHGSCSEWLCLEQEPCVPTRGERILQPA